jgi:agmatinase
MPSSHTKKKRLHDSNSHSRQTPRYANLSTFAQQPTLNSSNDAATAADIDIGVVGIPFDSGCTFRSGARFGPAAIRQASRLLRTYNVDQHVDVFKNRSVVDCGDIVCTPFNNAHAMSQIRKKMAHLLRRIRHMPVIIGGDHTISYPILKALHAHHTVPGGIALIHFDSHMDTFDEYFGARIAHGTPFRRAVEDGVINPHKSVHVGIHGSLNSSAEITQDEALGFHTIRGEQIFQKGHVEVGAEIRKRVGTTPCYISVDVDVVDPAFAPGTGTPEAGGISSFQLLAILRQLQGVHLIGGDVVEVSPAHDVSDITSLLAATAAYELIGLGTSYYNNTPPSK